MNRALFIGKFQPFHKGHLDAIEDLISSCWSPKTIIIGITDAQNSNPFSYETRKEMIEETLKVWKIKKYLIYPIEDIHDEEHWVEHVVKSVPHFDMVISNNKETHRLFNEKGFDEVLYSTDKTYGDISGTRIRELIKNGEEWKHLVPEPVYNIIKEIDLK